MNTTTSETPVDDARWQAQERAFRGDPEADADELRIARALRRAPPVALPVDFATQVAAMARTQAAANAVFEQRLLRALTLVFALSAAVVVAWSGRGWMADLAAILPGGGEAAGWTATAASCVLGNWAFGLLRKPFAPRMHAGA